MSVRIAAAIVVIGLGSLAASSVSDDHFAPDPCPARSQTAESVAVTWYGSPAEDDAKLDRWCRGVGQPIVVTATTSTNGDVVPLDDLVVVSWNAHLAEGRPAELIDRLRSGSLTDGRPVRHFVLLLQELFRRGEDVPVFGETLRSAHAIKARDPRAPDAWEYARTLGLSFFYVPSMRNGADLREDRGNAIITTEPILDPVALELPLERQRRVAIGVAIPARTSSRIGRLHLVDVHLEPLSSPASLWIFRNPRRRQVAAVLDFLQSARFEDDPQGLGTVLGGDFNTIQGGIGEEAYKEARRWSKSLVEEDSRSTHHMGRLDYLFFESAEGWTATTIRLDEHFGSDHYPVLARFAPPH